MKKSKKLLSLLLAMLLLFVTSLTAFAAVNDTGFTDVSEDAPYAEAVKYVHDNGIMSGTSNTKFSPDLNTSRAMLAMILYRMSGSPDVSQNANFADVAENMWYSNAVNWAAENNIVAGYDNGNFGVNDPVRLEQVVTILWRYAENTTQSQQDSYSAQAIQWATQNNIVSAPFEAAKNATRADVATILFRYMTLDIGESQTQPVEPEEVVTQPEQLTEDTENISNTLVVYFSATNNTKGVAENIAEALNADTYQIIAAQEYTSDDLDWTDDDSRVNAEHNDPDFRPEIAGELPELTNYDTIFVGYPIWWGEAPNIVKGFVENVDFDGKTVIPFCTSSSSGIGSSGRNLAALTNGANWLDGQRFSSRASESDVQNWISSLNLTTNANVAENANENTTQNTNSKKSLVVYFSMPETTNPNDMTTEEENSTVVINGEVLGNTQYMAQIIQNTIDADIFRIEPQTAYPTDHETLVDLALEEQNQNARPELLNTIDNLDEYDTIFVCYPNWWGDMPMILYTFFEQHDFSNKTIIAFNTHGGSGFSSTISTIRRLEPDAEVVEGLSISRNHIQDAENEIVEWVNGLD